MAKKKEVDWVKLDSYLEVLTSKRTCALLLDMHEDTLEAHVKSKFRMNFTDYAEIKKQPIKMKLVQKALTMANQGNVPMLIFCLKNVASWTDKQEVTQDVSDKAAKLIIDMK